MRTLCSAHGDVIGRLDRAIVGIEAARSDVGEIKADVKSLVGANGDRREAIGELRGRIVVMSALTALGVSGIVSLLIALLK